MQVKTKMCLIQVLTVALVMFILYVWAGLSYIYLDMIYGNISAEAYEEPWLRFGCICFMPMVILTYSTVVYHALKVTHNRYCKLRLEYDGKVVATIKDRSIGDDLFVIMIFLFVGSYVSREIYPYVETLDGTLLAIVGPVMAITCFCTMQMFQGLVDRQIAKYKRRKTQGASQ